MQIILSSFEGAGWQFFYYFPFCVCGQDVGSVFTSSWSLLTFSLRNKKY